MKGDIRSLDYSSDADGGWACADLARPKTTQQKAKREEVDSLHIT